MWRPEEITEEGGTERKERKNVKFKIKIKKLRGAAGAAFYTTPPHTRTRIPRVGNGLPGDGHN